jgi:hypothetical protein
LETVLHSEDRDHVLAKCKEAIEAGQPVEHEWRVVWSNGDIRWISGRFQTLRDQSGRVTRMTGVNINITERKQAEDIQVLLLKEMNHRVKNLFALMDSMVALSARTARTPSASGEKKYYLAKRDGVVRPRQT